MQNHWETYAYVDACWHDPETHKRSPWIRCHLKNFARFIIDPGRAIDCFASVQRYRDAARETTTTDSKPPETTADSPKEPKPNGSNGHHLPVLDNHPPHPFELPSRQIHYHGLFFDLDVPRERRELPRDQTLPEVQNDALRLAQYFLDGLELAPPAVQVWFSGSKGFHVLVRPEPFELEPHTQLTYAVKQIAIELRTKLELSNLDLSVYTVSRMWRVANTAHSSTGLYKIELTVNELAQLSSTDILTLAKEPRHGS
jgi:hypothetical protein